MHPNPSTDPIISKRLVFITGDKGGVGKSFTARTIVQFYLDTQVAFRGYDIDPVNPNLAQFYPDHTDLIDIQQPGALDEIRNGLERHNLILVDCAARSLADLDIWFREMGLFKQRQALRLSVTFGFVITPDKSCTAIMGDALDRFGTRANYFVVKNTAKGRNFSIYEGSKLRVRLIDEFRCREITLPPLLERTVVLLDNHDVNFGEAAASPHLTVADRSRVRGFLAACYPQFETLRDILLIP